MRVAFFFVLVLPPLTLACGWGTSSVTGTQPPSATDALAPLVSTTPCGALCSRERDCDASFPGDEECLRVCNEEFVFSRLRDDAEALFTACLADRSCQSILADHAVERCFEAVVDGPLDGSPSAGVVCDELAAALDECSPSLDLTECPARIRLYDDATIEASRQCTARDCTTRPTCINETLSLVRP